MTNRFSVLVTTIAVALIQSCAADKSPQPNEVDCSSIDTATNTYALSIKPILDNNCAGGGCHDAGSASSGVNLEGYQASKNAFETKPVLCTVKQSGGCVPMPIGAPKLADSLITKLQCWAANGYPQ